MTVLTREHELSTEKFVAEITYDIGMTKFGYGETEEKAVADALVDDTWVIEEILVFKATGKTKQRRICGSTRTFRIYEAI